MVMVNNNHNHQTTKSAADLAQPNLQ